MNHQRIKRIVIDVCMLFCLLGLMLHMRLGQYMHEYLGVIMFVLFVVHHIFQSQWFHSLRKGKYSFRRKMILSVNILLMVGMIGLFLSGIMMSQYAFPFLRGLHMTSLARYIHLFCSYWSFILMAIHIGLHGGMIANKLRQYPIIHVMKYILVFLGIYFLMKENIFSYLLLRNHFVFFNPQESLLFVLFEYFCILFFIAYFTYMLCGYRRKK